MAKMITSRLYAGLLRPRRSICSNHSIVKSSSSGKTDRILRSPCDDAEILEVPLTKFLWEKTVKDHGNKTAIVNGVTGEHWTFTQSYELVRAFGSSLSKYGFSKGDILAIFLPNMPQYLIAVCGAIGLGCAVTTINISYTSYEISRQLCLAKPKILLTSTQYIPILEEAIRMVQDDVPKISFILVDVPASSKNQDYFSYDKMVSDSGSRYPDTIKDFKFAEDIATLPFSSGTTGLSKGVMLTHKNVVSNLCQLEKIDEYYNVPKTSDTYQGKTLLVLPMYHVYGLNIISFVFLQRGGMIVTMPKFEPKLFIEGLEKFKPTTLYFAPPLLSFCANSPEVQPRHLESVMDIRVGAAPVGETLLQIFRKKGPHLRFKEGYGMSELSVATSSGPSNTILGSCGILLPNTEAKIRDLETGESLGPNETGELLIRGPQVMKGYLNNLEATKSTIDENGWLYTGDISKYDENHNFYIVDRLKELIKVKGFQVPPAELENLIRSYPGVQDVAVIGIPNDRTGELPRAYIVRKPGENFNENDLKKFVHERVSVYKRLEGGVNFVESIPKSPTGKILRRVLLEMWKTESI